MYYRFPTYLVFGIVSLSSIAPNVRAIESNSRHFNPNLITFSIAQIDGETGVNSTTPRQPIPGNYESYLQAARQAEMGGHYQKAIEYYQQALNLSPNNSEIKTSLTNVIGYAFDSYMQAGYVADRLHDYPKALSNFRQASLLKPDSFHARQAIRNVNNYLTFAPQPTEGETKPTVNLVTSDSSVVQSDLWVESNKIWFICGIFATSIVSILLLTSLFRSERKTAKRHTKIVRRSMSESTPTTPQKAKVLPKLDLTKPQPITPAVPETVENNSDSSVTPIETNPLPTPAATVVVSSHHQLLETQTNSIDSGTVHPVTIVTSKTTKIDLVLELIKDLQQGEREIRRKAIWELAQKSDSRGIIPLIEIMPQVDSLERNLILEAITQITSRTLQPMNRVLLESLEDDNPQVRKNAIRDLTRLYHLMSQVTKRLSQMTEDVDLEVQQTARWALQQLDRVPAAKQAMQQGKDKG
jgi:hypothetical protein